MMVDGKKTSPFAIVLEEQQKFWLFYFHFQFEYFIFFGFLLNFGFKEEFGGLCKFYVCEFV